MNIRSVLFIFLSVLVSGSYAATPMSAYQIPNNVSIFTDGTLEVSFPELIDTSCTAGAGKRIFVKAGNSQGVTEESFKYIKSVVLTALTAQMPIKFEYGIVDNACMGGKVNITTP